MNDEKRDERSMSEILSSIRRIVTDEEKTRREADEQRRDHEAESGASVFVLTDDMRSGDAAPKPSVDFDEPLHLEPEAPFVLDDPVDPAPAEEDASPDLAEDPVYAPEPVYPPDPIYTSDPITPDDVEPFDPLGEDDDATPEQDVIGAPAFGLSEADVEEIVRRIVREELQGSVGQQITRKLKRVIRDEIARALDQEDDGLI